MTVRIGDIVIDCQDARLAAVFWCAALGYRITESDDTGVAVAGDSMAPLATTRSLGSNHSVRRSSMSARQVVRGSSCLIRTATNSA